MSIAGILLGGKNDYDLRCRSLLVDENVTVLGDLDTNGLTLNPAPPFNDDADRAVCLVTSGPGDALCQKNESEGGGFVPVWTWNLPEASLPTPVMSFMRSGRYCHAVLTASGVDTAMNPVNTATISLPVAPVLFAGGAGELVGPVTTNGAGSFATISSKAATLLAEISFTGAALSGTISASFVYGPVSA